MPFHPGFGLDKIGLHHVCGCDVIICPQLFHIRHVDQILPLFHVGRGLAQDAVDLRDGPVDLILKGYGVVDNVQRGVGAPGAEEELLAGYDAVLHLVTCAKGAEFAYNYGNAYFNSNRMWEYWPAVKITNSTGFSAIPTGYCTTSSTGVDGRDDFNYAVYWTAEDEDVDGESFGLYRMIYVEKPDLMLGIIGTQPFRISLLPVLRRQGQMTEQG